MRPIVVWIVVGLLGLVLAAGVSYAATLLSSQRIGLAAEPPSAGEDLAPAAARTTTATARPARTTTARTVPRTSTAPAPVQTAPPTAAPTQSSPAPATSSGGDDGEGGGSSGSGSGRDD